MLTFGHQLRCSGYDVRHGFYRYCQELAEIDRKFRLSKLILNDRKKTVVYTSLFWSLKIERPEQMPVTLRWWYMYSCESKAKIPNMFLTVPVPYTFLTTCVHTVLLYYKYKKQTRVFFKNIDITTICVCVVLYNTQIDVNSNGIPNANGICVQTLLLVKCTSKNRICLHFK